MLAVKTAKTFDKLDLSSYFNEQSGFVFVLHCIYYVEVLCVRALFSHHKLR